MHPDCDGLASILASGCHIDVKAAAAPHAPPQMMGSIYLEQAMLLNQNYTARQCHVHWDLVKPTVYASRQHAFMK